jgi:hypothetical protein
MIRIIEILLVVVGISVLGGMFYFPNASPFETLVILGLAIAFVLLAAALAFMKSRKITK